MSAKRVLFVGRATLDVLYALDEFPTEDTKCFAREMRAAPGGPALNAAITHSLLGGKAVLMSAIGGGPWAGPVLGELERLGIDRIDLAAGTTYETPLTTVLVHVAGATRTAVNPPQVVVALGRFSEWNSSWGDLPPVVLADGFHLMETLPLLKACREAGAAICLDGGSWKPGTAELAPFLTAAICSERFVAPGQAADADATVRWFVEKGVPHVAITRGARSILGWDRGRPFAIDVAPIEAVDTLGAGDVLHGAFCHYSARGEAFEPALRKASEIATRSCLGMGVRAWRESQ